MNIAEQASNLEVNALSIEQFTLMLGQVLEDVNGLSDMHDTLARYRGHPINVVANAIAVEMVNSKLDYMSRTYGVEFPALENNMPEGFKLTVAAESIAEMVVKVWQTIIKVLKLLWTKIKEFFGKVENFLFGSEEKLNRIEEKVKSISDDVQPLKAVATEKAAVEIPYFVEALCFPDSNHIDYSNANKHINSSSRMIDYLNEMLRAIMGGTRKIFDAKAGSEEVRAAYFDLQQKLTEGLIDTLPVHKSVKKGEHSIKVLGPIVGQHYVATDDPSDKIEQFFSIAQEPKASVSLDNVKVLSKKEMLNLIAALKYAITTNKKLMSGITGNIESLNKECQKVADQMSKSSAESDVHKQIKNNVKSCSDFCSDCLRLLQWGVPTTVKAVVGYIDYSCKFYTSERDEDFSEILKGSKNLAAD